MRGITTNDDEVLLKKEVFRIAGCAIEVLNDRITNHEHGLMLNYVRTTRLRSGVILNFKRSKLEWERIIL
jgi:hypothetical protein